jgi:peptidoglycan L-alanyl-D-glutamate endopeptidase CwlK
MDLQHVLEEAIKHVDFSVICGHRGKEDQDQAFMQGKSTLQWPASKHNLLPSHAVDIAPYPKLYSATDEEWAILATHVLGAASKLGVKVRWGGHWKRFVDKPHFEIIS